MPARLVPLAAVAALTLTATACAQLNDEDTTTRDEGGEIEEGGDVGAFALQVGDCFDEPSLAAAGEGEDTEVDEVSALPCDEPHDYQVFAAFDVADADAYPGEESLVDDAEERCLAEFEPFVGVAYESSELLYTYLFPTEGSWGVGDREIVCLLASLDGEKLTGDAQGSAQ